MATQTIGPCREFQGRRLKDRGYGLLGRKVSTGLHHAGKGHDMLLHRWVMEEYLGRPLTRVETVCHHCDNPPCFRFDHLFISTQAGNLDDMRRRSRWNAKGTRTILRGSATNSAKLTEGDVLRIRERLATGEGPSKIGLSYGVSRNTIGRVKSGETWGHVRSEDLDITNPER